HGTRLARRASRRGAAQSGHLQWRGDAGHGTLKLNKADRRYWCGSALFGKCRAAPKYFYETTALFPVRRLPADCPRSRSSAAAGAVADEFLAALSGVHLAGGDIF